MIEKSQKTEVGEQANKKANGANATGPTSSTVPLTLSFPTSVDASAALLKAKPQLSKTDIEEKKATIRARMAALQNEGKKLEILTSIISGAESVTQFIHEGALIAGQGVAMVVAGPAGGAAFRTGVGAISHLGQAGVQLALGESSSVVEQQLKKSISDDAIEGAFSFVGGKAASGAAKLFAGTATKNLSATMARLATGEVAGLASTTVQNIREFGCKVLNGESITANDFAHYGLNYAASIASAGIGARTSGATTAKSYLTEAGVNTGLAAGQQYVETGTVALDGTLTSALSNVTQGYANARHISQNSARATSSSVAGTVNLESAKEGPPVRLTPPTGKIVKLIPPHSEALAPKGEQIASKTVSGSTKDSVVQLVRPSLKPDTKGMAGAAPGTYNPAQEPAEIYKERHASGKHGVPPGLRENDSINNIVSGLPSEARKSWNKEELFHIVRGYKFGLEAMGIPENRLNQEISEALKNSFKGDLKGNLHRVWSVIADHFSDPSISKVEKVLMAASAPVSLGGMLCVYIPLHQLFSFRKGGDTLGGKIAFNVKTPEELGLVAAHEVVHRHQDHRDRAHVEYFSWAVHAAYCYRYDVDSSRFSVKPKSKSDKRGYFKDLHSSAAAVLLYRGVSEVEGPAKAQESLQASRFAYTKQKLKDLYFSRRSPKDSGCSY